MGFERESLWESPVAAMQDIRHHSKKHSIKLCKLLGLGGLAQFHSLRPLWHDVGRQEPRPRDSPEGRLRY